MGPAEVEPERFGTLDHPGHVSIATEQVVDQLAAQRFLLPDQLLGSDLVAVHQDGDRFTDRPQYRLGRGADRVTVAVRHDVRQIPPHPPRRGQVQVDNPSRRNTLLCGATPEFTHDRQLMLSRTPPGDGSVREQGEVFDQQLQRRLCVAGGCLRDRRQPGLVGAVGGAVAQSG